MTATDLFLAHRNLLFTVAYEILGSAADAEDVLQDTWLRWSEVDQAEVRSPRSYLVRITTRLALNRLRTLQRRRESYVGPWLPEPLLTTADVAEDVELAESVSTAMMLVLETLTPTERAVFVLHEVFDVGYDELADLLGKSQAAVRQICHRARSHVESRRPRQRVDAEQRDEVITRFMQAASSGNLHDLVDVLAPDVVMVSDGGGVVKAALRPIVGREKVIRWLQAVAAGPVHAEVAMVNGSPGLRILSGGTVELVASMHIQDGHVTGLYLVRNPRKLGWMETPVELTR